MATLQQRLEKLKELDRRKFDYVVARSRTNSVVEACELSGFSRPVYYRLPEEERQELEDLADELHRDAVMAAYLKLEEATEKAANVKVQGLDSGDERIRQKAASDILSLVFRKKLDVSLQAEGKLEFSWDWKPQQEE